MYLDCHAVGCRGPRYKPEQRKPSITGDANTYLWSILDPCKGVYRRSGRRGDSE